MTRLRITARREADLVDLGVEAAAAIVEKFTELRAQAPASGEVIVGLRQRACMSLHAGRYRAVTWYNREWETVWLLAAGIHRADSREDAYNQAILLTAVFADHQPRARDESDYHFRRFAAYFPLPQAAR